MAVTAESVKVDVLVEVAEDDPNPDATAETLVVEAVKAVESVIAIEVKRTEQVYER